MLLLVGEMLRYVVATCIMQKSCVSLRDHKQQYTAKYEPALEFPGKKLESPPIKHTPSPHPPCIPVSTPDNNHLTTKAINVTITIQKRPTLTEVIQPHFTS